MRLSGKHYDPHAGTLKPLVTNASKLLATSGIKQRVLVNH